MELSEKKCKCRGKCGKCGKKRKHGLAWGNENYYGAIPVGGGSGDASSLGAIGETVIKDFIRSFIVKING